MIGLVSLSLASNAQDPNGARPKKATQEKSAKTTTKADKTEKAEEVDQYGNKKGTPAYEEQRKADRMNAERKQD